MCSAPNGTPAQTSKAGVHFIAVQSRQAVLSGVMQTPAQFFTPQAMTSPQHAEHASESMAFVFMQSAEHFAGSAFRKHILPHALALAAVASAIATIAASAALVHAPGIGIFAPPEPAVPLPPALVPPAEVPPVAVPPAPAVALPPAPAALPPAPAVALPPVPDVSAGAELLELQATRATKESGNKKRSSDMRRRSHGASRRVKPRMDLQ